MEHDCVNALDVHGDAADLVELTGAVRGAHSALDFDRVAPLQAGVDTRATSSLEIALATTGLLRAGEGTLHARRIQTWGTAAPAARVEVSGDYLQGVEYRFLTVSEPPARIVERLAGSWPRVTLDLAYVNPCTGVAGRLVLGPGVRWDARSNQSGYIRELLADTRLIGVWLGWDEDDGEPESVGR